VSLASTVDCGRAKFRPFVTARELENLAAKRQVKVLQTDRPAPDDVWRLVNDVFIKQRSEVQLRLFHGPTDLSFLRFLPDLRIFSADCMLTATNVDYLAQRRFRAVLLNDH